MHLHNVLTEVIGGILKDKQWFDEVYEYATRVEFQQRGTLHLHIAAWAIVRDDVDLRGNSAEGRWSSFVRMLSSYGLDHNDV